MAGQTILGSCLCMSLGLNGVVDFGDREQIWDSRPISPWLRVPGVNCIPVCFIPADCRQKWINCFISVFFQHLAHNACSIYAKLQIFKDWKKNRFYPIPPVSLSFLSPSPMSLKTRLNCRVWWGIVRFVVNLVLSSKRQMDLWHSI